MYRYINTHASCEGCFVHFSSPPLYRSRRFTIMMKTTRNLPTLKRQGARTHKRTDLYPSASPPSQKTTLCASSSSAHTRTHTHAPAHVYNIMLSDGQASRFHHIPLSPSTVPDKTIAKLAPLENAYYIMVYIFSVRVLYQSA